MMDFNKAAQVLFSRLLSNGKLAKRQRDCLEHDILPWMGHYRVDRFDQRRLEDFRQRAARRGVSLNRFRGELLPAIRLLLETAAQEGTVGAVPPLCDYMTRPLRFDTCSAAWLKDLRKQAAVITVQRYENILTTQLLPAFGQEDLACLDLARVERYRADQFPSGVGDSAFKQHLAILYGVLDHVITKRFSFEKKEPVVQPVRLHDVALQWLEEDAKSCVPITVEQHRTVLFKYLLPALGEQALSTLTARKIADYQRSVAKKGISKATFTSHRAVVNGILDYALRQGLIQHLPDIKTAYPKKISAIRRPDETAMRRVVVTDFELPSALIVRLAWQMGLTRRELRELRWSDLDLDRLDALVQGRTVPIPVDLCAFLREVREETGPEGTVLRSVRGNHMSSESISIEARKCLSRHGMDEIRLTDLRHDYVIRLLETEPLNVVAERCGYKNPEDLVRLYRGYLP